MVGVLRCCDDLRFCTWLDSEKVLNFSYIYIYIKNGHTSSGPI